MITKTSLEIYENALTLANMTGYDTFNFFQINAILNNLYRDLYEKVASSSSDYFTKRYSFYNPDTFDIDPSLPNDLFFIKHVFYNNKAITRTQSHKKDTGYYVENNELYVNGYPLSDITIEYVPIPQTLTIPAPSIKLDVNKADIKEILGLNEEIMFWVDKDDFIHEYNMFDKSDAKLEEKYTPTLVPKAPVDEYGIKGCTTKKVRVFDGVLEWNESENLYKYFISGRQKDVSFSKDFTNIFRVVADSHYVVVSYFNGTIRVYTSLDNYYDYNINSIYGRKTLGVVFGIYHNDRTGYGLIYSNSENDELYLASFVPDTVLNFPNNVCYSLMEYQLAQILGNLSGQDTSLVDNMISKKEKEFFKTLSQVREPIRIKNVRSR